MSSLQYLYDHPELIAVIWPVLTALLSLVHGALARRYPALVEVLRASGLDLPGVLRALRAVLTKPTPPAPAADAAPITTNSNRD